MRRRSLYGRLDAGNPEAAARCDRGGEIRKRSELVAEMRWSGDKLVPTGFLCCRQHRDALNPADRLLVLRADPEVAERPRPHLEDMVAEALLGGPLLLVDEDDVLLAEDGEEFLA